MTTCAALGIRKTVNDHDEPRVEASINRILDTMIELARCSVEHRIMLAGAKESDRMFEWRRRGYRRVVTPATCRLPHGQCDVVCVEWRRHSIKALEVTLEWLVHFLSPTGALVIWIDTPIDTPPGRRHLRSAIDRFGFRVETGIQCGCGFAISARRIAASEQTIAALSVMPRSSRSITRTPISTTRACSRS